MTRYVTTPEDMYKCVPCELICAKRELVQINDYTRNCPRCGQTAIIMLNINDEKMNRYDALCNN